MALLPPQAVLAVKNLPVQETYEMHIPSLGGEDTLEEAWHPLQYSCLENPMVRGAWWGAVYRVTESQTQ